MSPERRVRGRTVDSPEYAGTPLVSIITACFNARDSLEAAILSVRAQTYPNIEHIIIDGGSSDGTVDVIRKHSAGLAYWVSEPDNGIADAWNKGLARAKGGIVATLNADDAYDAEAVAKAVDALGGDDWAIVYGTAHYFDTHPGKTVAIGDLDFDPAVLEFGFGFMHTTCFVPKRVYGEVGGFDSRYRIAIDSDFLLRCHYRGIPFRKGGNLTHMRTGGLSQRRQTRAYLEFLQQLLRNGYPRWKIARALLGHYKRRLFAR